MQIDAAARNGFRQDHFANCLAIRCPQALKRAERWPEVDAGFFPRAIECRHILRLHTRLQSVHIDVIDSPACPASKRNLALGMKRPALFGFALAEYLYMPCVPALGCAQQGLDFSPGLRGVVSAILPGKDQRAVQLQILHIHQLRTFG